VVKFGGVGITDKEVVYNKGEGSGVGVVAEEHGGGGFRETVLGEKGDKTKLG
jgi:hypothetical protein